MPLDFTPDKTLFQAAFENSYDVVEFLREDGTILYTNPSVTRVLGFEPQSLVGTSVFDLVHPEDKARFQQELAAALTQERAQVEVYRCRTTNGEWRYMQSAVSHLSTGQSPTIIVNSRDVTEQEEARRHASQTNQEVHIIWESITDALLALDKDWRVTYLNGAGETLLQCQRHEMLGRILWEVFPEAVDTTFFVQYHKAVQEQVEVTFEEFYAPMGIWFEIHAYPSDAGLAIYFRNINERKQSDEKLRASEERFRRIFEAGPLGIVVVAPDVSISLMNDRLCQMLGYSEQELRALNIQGVTHPDDIKADEHLAMQLFAGVIPSYQLEKRYLTKDGRIVWGLLTGTLVRDDQGQPLYGLGFVEDITQRKEVEEMLRRSEANLATAQQMAHLGSWEWELTPHEDWRDNRVHWSDEVFRILGYKPGEVEVSFDIFKKALHPDDSDMVEAITDHALSNRRGYDLDHRVLLPNGTERVVHEQANFVFDDAGKPIRIIGTIQDITERKQSEVQLHFQKALLEAQTETSPDGILVVAGDGKILSYNQRFLEMWQVPPHIAASGEDAPLLHSVVGKVVNPEQFLAKVIYLYEHRDELSHEEIFLHDGRVFERYSAPVASSNGMYYGRVWYFRDITDREHAKVALLKANDELELHVMERTAELATANDLLRIENHQHQMTMEALRELAQALQLAKEEADSANAAKSEFLSRMSHELRTPLNAILGFGQILEMQDDLLSVQQQQHIGQILKGGNHLLGLINEVLDIASVEAGGAEFSLAPVCVQEVVAEVYSLVGPLAAKRHIKLVHNVTGEPVFVLADLQRFKQVLLNLLSNAIKYNRERGQVYVSIETGAQSSIAIAVTDTGPGIAPQDLSKLFVPFERLGAATLLIEGTGLGLVLSQRLVKAMNGTLNVDSVLGRGTTFTIELPQAEPPLELSLNLRNAQNAVSSDDEQRAGQTSAVLCIEDNPANLYLIEAILERRPKVKLLTAIQGSVGLDIAHQYEPDLILLDLHLPDIMGEEVLRRLQQSDTTRDIPVVVVSADATEQQFQRLMEAGAKAYLTKPLNVALFLRLLDDVLQPPINH